MDVTGRKQDRAAATRSWLLGQPVLADCGLALVLVALSSSWVMYGIERWEALFLLLSVVQVTPLFFRSRYPVGAAWAAVAVFAAQQGAVLLATGLAGMVLPAGVVVLILIYGVIVYGDRRTLPPLVVVTELAAIAVSIVPSLVNSNATVGAGVLLALFLTAALVASLAIGDSVATRRTQLAEARAHAREATERKDALARAAVAEERARIAREMHDVVAHAVSTIVMQAEGARLVGIKEPATALAALATISRTGREAIGELRSILGLLRRPDDDTDPQPGIGDLAELARSAGTGVALEIEGDPAGVPAGAAVTAYRIVQEALTNVRKHGPQGTVATVRIGCGGAEDTLRRLSIEIVNGGGACPAAVVPGAGHGLLGMRERVAMYDGELLVEPLPGGGFRVAATLVLTGVPSRDTPIRTVKS